MPEADVEAAQALADVATIAILQHRAALEAQGLGQQLQHALNSRIVIEQAKGMVAEREKTQHGAGVLRITTHARDHNLRLVDVAEAVIGGSLAPSALGGARKLPLTSAGSGDWRAAGARHCWSWLGGA